MLGPSKEEESAAAGAGGGPKRGAGAAVSGGGGGCRRAPGRERAAGGAGTGGATVGVPGGTRPVDVGAEGSARVFGGGDRGGPGTQCQHREGEAVSGETKDCRECAATVEAAEVRNAVADRSRDSREGNPGCLTSWK